jgi:hypothetical protein
VFGGKQRVKICRIVCRAVLLLPALVALLGGCNSAQPGADGRPHAEIQRSADAQKNKAEGEPPRALLGGERPTASSLLQLIARPEFYRGAKAIVTGYMVLEPHRGGSDGFLYVHREDAMWLLSNMVRVKFGRCRFSRSDEGLLTVEDVRKAREFPDDVNGYVLVEGVFEPYEPGGPFVGEICGITRVTPKVGADGR